MEKQTTGIGSFIFGLVMFGLLMGVLVAAGTNLCSRPQDEPCDSEIEARSFQCINLQVIECIESDLYTREECIVLIGGGK